jgi:hypothetical protein
MNGVLAALNPTAQFLSGKYLSKLGGDFAPPSLL